MAEQTGINAERPIMVPTPLSQKPAGSSDLESVSIFGGNRSAEGESYLLRPLTPEADPPAK